MIRKGAANCLSRPFFFTFAEAFAIISALPFGGIMIYAPVAQLDRVSDSDSEGRAFESHQAYHVGASDIKLAPMF